MPGAGVRVVVDERGLVVVKSTGLDAGRREAARLRVAQHEGVVELLGAVERDTPDGAAVELHLRFAGATTVDARALAAPEVLEVACTLADTLADLHRRGICHGRLRAEHVVVDADGHPVLCGLGAGGSATPADDVAALCALIQDLIASDAHRRPTGRSTDRGEARRRRAALGLLHSATADPPADASTLAAALRDTSTRSPGPAPPAPELAGAAARTGRRLRPLAALVSTAAASAVALLAGGALGAPVSPDDDHGCADRAAPAVELGPAPVPLDHDGDGAAAPATWDDGLLAVGDERWSLGAAGDRVVVGDWDCDGTASPALLRADGTVFAFEGWGGPDGAETAVAADPAAVATGAGDADTGDGDGPP